MTYVSGGGGKELVVGVTSSSTVSDVVKHDTLVQLGGMSKKKVVTKMEGKDGR